MRKKLVEAPPQTDDPLINGMIKLQNLAEQDASRYAAIADRIDFTILVLSVITSGGLWALAADALPKQFGWLGASVSTIVTFLTIYMYSSGVQKKRKSAIVLYEEITEYLGEIRGAPYLDENEFWIRYKAFEKTLTKLRLEKAE